MAWFGRDVFPYVFHCSARCIIFLMFSTVLADAEAGSLNRIHGTLSGSGMRLGLWVPRTQAQPGSARCGLSAAQVTPRPGRCPGLLPTPRRRLGWACPGLYGLGTSRHRLVVTRSQVLRLGLGRLKLCLGRWVSTLRHCLCRLAATWATPRSSHTQAPLGMYLTQVYQAWVCSGSAWTLSSPAQVQLG